MAIKGQRTWREFYFTSTDDHRAFVSVAAGIGEHTSVLHAEPFLWTDATIAELRLIARNAGIRLPDYITTDEASAIAAWRSDDD